MSSSANVPYEVLLDACKFLCRNQLYKLTLTSRWVRKVVLENQMYWPRFRCYRLTLLEYFAANTLARVRNFSDFPIELKAKLGAELQPLKQQLLSSTTEDVQIPLFLDNHEPIFLVFEFSDARKFFIQLDPFLNARNLEKLVFWIDQISGVFFDEEIRGGLLDLYKFSPELLALLDSHGLGKLLQFHCKIFGCYEYEAFNKLSVKFVLEHMNIGRLDKANGTIYSPELLELLHNGAECCGAFSTRWVMGCGQEFTDNLIQYALNTNTPEKIIPFIQFTPSFHRQRELPIPRKSLILSAANVSLIKRELGDWKFEEWALQNFKKKNFQFRVSMFLYNDIETDEEAISQFSIERTIIDL